MTDIPEDVMKRLEALERRVASLEHEARFRLWSGMPEVAVATDGQAHVPGVDPKQLLPRWRP